VGTVVKITNLRSQGAMDGMKPKAFLSFLKVSCIRQCRSATAKSSICMTQRKFPGEMKK